MTTKANSWCRVIMLAACALAVPLATKLVSAQGINQQPVNLSSYYNVNGIYTDGTATSNNGYDGVGYGYSETAIQDACGSAGPPNTAYACSGTYPALSFAESTSVTVNFQFGPADAPDAVTGEGLGPITLPSGQFTELQMLGSGVEGAQTGSVVVNYTDGSNTTLEQTFGDWYSSKCTDTGELAGLITPYRITPTGTDDDRPFYICFYNLAIDPTKTVSTLVLPSNRSIIIMAATVVAIPGFSTAAGTPSATTVSPGSSITVPVSAVSEAGYGGTQGNTVNLACTVSPAIQSWQSATPPSCTFNPASVVVAVGSPGTSTLTFTPAAGASSAMASQSSRWTYALWLPIPGLALIGLGTNARTSRRRRLLGLLLLGVLLVALLAAPACVSYTHLGNVGTPPGQYTISVTGSDQNGNTQLGAGGTVTVTVQ